MQTITRLTPNRRLAASLLKEAQATALEAKQLTWSSPDILPFSSWLERLWQDYTAKTIAAHPLLLNPEQEQLLWENILRESPANTFLLQISETARLARAAWNTLKAWRTPLNHPGLISTEDSATFLLWAHTFTERCEKNQWLDSASLIVFLLEKINAGSIRLPNEIQLAGFTELTPLQEALLEACKTQGCHITHKPLPQKNNTLHRLRLPDETQEILTMARWAKSLYDTHPEATIACTIPNLEKCREKVLRLFADTFSPEGSYTLDPTQLPFNVSAGRHLADYPVIHLGLQLLHIAPDKMPLPAFSQLLSSPYIAGAETEVYARAMLDTQLKKANISTLVWQRHLKDWHATCPQLASSLEKYIALQLARPSKQTFSFWITHFTQALTALGWPGERSLNSHEYQTVTAWLNCLTNIASFENILEPMSYQAALECCTQLISTHVFQVQSPEARIQLLGLLEATEIPFDYLWVMGLDDTAWPPAPKPNPFIPQHLQKSLQMPHATAEKELTYCQTLTTQLQRTAKTVIFSSAEKNEEAELRPSPLITDLPEITIKQITLSPLNTPALPIFTSRSCEFFHDEIALPLEPREKEYGGASLFELQAACPFKAFAELRLHAKIPDAPTLGLQAKERGTLIHNVMEILWSDLKDQAQLLSLSDSEVEQRIGKAVHKAIHSLASDALSNPRYQAIEAERLQILIKDWITLEKARPPFKIHALEHSATITISDIPVRVRIDRVDTTEAGDTIIIDYKTGNKNDITGWFGTRPDKPQLPLYALIDSTHTEAITYAQIHTEKMKWAGLSAHELDIPGIRSTIDWQAHLSEWRQTLTQLGSEYTQGYAAVDPKDGDKTCEYCELKTFCRIHEEITP